MTDYLCRHTLGRTSTVPIRQSTAPDSPLQAGTISHFKERPRVPCADFIFDRGTPAPGAKPSILSEVLASSSRLALRVWIIFEDPRPCPSIPLRGSSCPSIPLRGSSCELRSSFGEALYDHLRWRMIEDHLRQSSLILRSCDDVASTSFVVEGLCTPLMPLEDFAPEATFLDEKSPTTILIKEKEYYITIGHQWLSLNHQNLINADEIN